MTDPKPPRIPPRWLVDSFLRARHVVGRGYRGSVPPTARVLEGSFGLIETKALGAAAELGIADERGAGSLTNDSLAERVQANPDALRRLLRLLTSIGYFSQDGNDRWRNNAASDRLRADHPESMRDWVLFLGSDWIGQIWNELQASIRTGGSGTEAAFGTEYFDLMVQRPEAGALFDAAMAAASRFTAPFVRAGYDFGSCRRVCDVGGGTGTLLASILEAFPRLQGIVFDLPEVVAGAPKELAARGVADRCEVIGGDFFAEVPAGCDLYLLQSIVHDWDDESAVRILTRVRKAMTPGSRALLLEAVVPTSPVNHPSKYADLLMLVLTGRGRERTEAEYRALAARAGLRIERVVNLLARDGIELVVA
ncbi:MAG: methyltransferase [Acidimicrobiia bacterium]